MSIIKLQESIDIFLCPVCGKKMKACDSKGIVCMNKHNFDLSRNGYANLLLNPSKSDYDKKLLRSRSIICKSGFFEPLLEHISTLLLKSSLSEKTDNIKILDAGCGEGSHLAQIVNKLSANSSSNITGFGIDISKDGIQLASRKYPGIVWCVADLARLPFAAGRFNVILSILSPSNYSEFNRVISDNGIVIKVVPESSYLKELRSYFYAKTDKETYSNKNVVEHFKRSFSIQELQRVRYTVPMDKENLAHLVKMTPLSWNVQREKSKNIFDLDIDSITVDLSIIAGAKKKSR